MIIRSTLFALCVCQLGVAADITPLPNPGNAVGLVLADQPGKWLVITVDRSTLAIAFQQIKLLDGGKAVYWEGKPGSYGVVFFADDGTQSTANLVLGGSAPVPPPPGPDPSPGGLWNLTTISRDQARSAGLNATQAANVAANYRQVASRLLSGAIRDANAAKLEIKALNREDVPEADRARWAPWSTAIINVLAAHDSELVADMKLLASAYEAIAAGLTP